MKYIVMTEGQDRIVMIKCKATEYLNGELDKHIECGLRMVADKIIVEITNNYTKKVNFIGDKVIEDKKQLAKLICEATQKTNYKCTDICKDKCYCAYCLTMAEHILQNNNT